MNRKTKTKEKEKEKEKKVDEVEQLLQSAQDEIMLNLSLNSHIARASPSAEKDSDLDRRFHALKMKSDSPLLPPPLQDHELKSVLGEDLSARFAALKAKSSSDPLTPTVATSNAHTLYDYEEESEDEEVQVQKLIEWAKDAARLNPSPPSSDDDQET
ncbi:uncharacterized protein LOC133307408 [Gastrolobium bilobum]|uniref:uncharacterized protein LOC133307408 n=1 Tax=Gastrolobium bilobum TaxID=150636 RepID=UPI002AB111DE|nr:uncharacterized protein LOC133307408 [Gastrolobium bilobum]